jgi:amino acid permease
MLVTLGYAVLLVFVVPLASMRLTDNILIQFISLVATLIISLEWVDVFGKNGFNADLMPVIGHDLSQIVGSIMFNYAFITTVPSWLNSKHPSVPVKKTIWVSLIMATLIYVVIGLTGMSMINSCMRYVKDVVCRRKLFPFLRHFEYHVCDK